MGVKTNIPQLCWDYGYGLDILLKENENERDKFQFSCAHEISPT